MSDPYHTYDNHNIQINIFRVNGPLLGRTLSEKDKLMHREAYLFNVKDPQKPEINFPKKDINSVAEWAKSDIIKLEVDNLKKQIELEQERIKKMFLYSDKKFKNINFITDKI